MSEKKTALGRGLGALLDHEGLLRSKEDAHTLVSGTFALPLSAIKPNPFQPRHDFNPESLDSLAQSISQLGVIQPITVRAIKDEEFELISGERRLRAAKLAGIEKIPAYIRPAKGEQMLEMALVENVQREELNPIDVALGYQRLIDEYELTQEDVARRVGKQRSTIANFLRLLHLPPNIQIGLRENALTPGHARALLALRNEKTQQKLFEEIQRQDLSVREVERRVKLQQKQTRKPKTTPILRNPHVVDVENELRKYLGTKVRVKESTKDRGQIEIHYYSKEDFSRVLDLLTGAIQ